MEEQRHYETEGSLLGPSFTYRRAFVRPRSAETLVCLALCALSALLVSLAWILGGKGSVETKQWSILLGLSAVAAMSLIAGLTKSENDKLRAEFAESEERTLAAIELMIQDHRVQPPAFAVDDRGTPSTLGVRLDRVGAARADPGQTFTNEFRLFMQGRESRDDELRGGSA